MNGFRIRPPAAAALASAALLAALVPALLQPPANRPPAGSPALFPDCGPTAGSATCTRWGPAAALGHGTVRTYGEYANGIPRALGVSLTAAALTGLPTAPTDGRHCYDADGDDRIDAMHECVGGHSRELALPVPSSSPSPSSSWSSSSSSSSPAEIPFRWALFNWNPYGHNPHGRYDVPHFDVHFYLVPQEDRAAIRTGGCALLIACDQLDAAGEPVPAAYLPAGYPASSPQTAEGAMGAHLDSRPPTTGTLSGQTFIYGAYAGRLIFLEPMLTKEFLEQHATAPAPHRTCEPVPQPKAWQAPGWYPTRYCTAYRPERGDYTVSLTDFVHAPGMQDLATGN